MLRFFRHLGHPALTLALIFLVGLDVSYWHSMRRGHTSVVGRVFGIHGLQRGSGPNLRWAEAYLVDEAGVLRVFPGRTPDGVTYMPYAAPGHTPLASLLASPTPSHSGLIAPVFTRTSHTLWVTPIAVPSLSAAQLAAARAGYADHLAAWLTHRGDPASPIPDLLAAGDGVHTEINTVPLIHDTLMAPVVLLAAASCIMTFWRAVRWGLHRPPPPHQCPRCGYDLTGLPGSAVCPECGEGGM